MRVLWGLKCPQCSADIPSMIIRTTFVPSGSCKRLSAVFTFSICSFQTLSAKEEETKCKPWLDCLEVSSMLLKRTKAGFSLKLLRKASLQWYAVPTLRGLLAAKRPLIPTAQRHRQTSAKGIALTRLKGLIFRQIVRL